MIKSVQVVRGPLFVQFEPMRCDKREREKDKSATAARSDFSVAQGVKQLKVTREVAHSEGPLRPLFIDLLVIILVVCHVRVVSIFK